ncbi:MAG: ATP-dependent Clp protease ATP-binding subunit [Patescibacteria group bacterium]
MREDSILNKFTSHYQHVISIAHRFAMHAHTPTIEPIHILWGLASEAGSLAHEILQKAGLPTPSLPQEEIKNVTGSVFALPLTDTVKTLIKKSVLAASHYRHKYIGTEHLLLGLLNVRDARVERALQEHHIDLRLLKKQAVLVMKSTSRFPDLTHVITHDEIEEEEDIRTHAPKTKTPALDFFANELTSDATQARLDPVVGRAREINRIIHILSRKTKNNPILLGDPGVGKTAIVEGLAKRIGEGKVPDLLLRKRIYSLDLTLLVAGTMYRGEFESRIKQVLDEVRADPNIILFIDEIHNIIGAGSASGSLDVANILKPALARGEIHCIGATTYEEYKQHLETDPALERRFQAIQVNEPSVEEAIEILKGVKASYEAHHHVSVEDDALVAAAQLSAQYLPEKRLPDKAIDLIDEAAAMKRVRSPGSSSLRELRNKESALEKVKREKEEAVRKENFPLALKKKEEERALAAAIAELHKNEREYESDVTRYGNVNRDDIIHVLSDITGIPLGKIEEEERGHLVNLETLLRERIIGQEEVLHELASFIRRSRAGLAGDTRPLGSFMFLGPSGVGKTETAKVLAEVMSHDPQAFIRFDMSEFSESFNISKLIGAPAGYVGYREGGKLTELVRRKPFSVILFDEIEKAHPDVFNLFLSILDEGFVMDAAGRRVNFRNTIIIMTSNIGLSSFNASAALGFSSSGNKGGGWEQTKLQVMGELQERFHAEFLNRIDRILIFRPLTIASLTLITEQQLRQLQAQLAKQSIVLEWNKKGVDLITKLSQSPTEGARKISRVLRKEVEDPVTDLLLTHKVNAGAVIRVGVRKNTIVIVNSKK